MQPTHPIRLGLALNFSVFYYEILNSPEKACQLAKQVRIIWTIINVCSFFLFRFFLPSATLFWFLFLLEPDSETKSLPWRMTHCPPTTHLTRENAAGVVDDSQRSYQEAFEVARTKMQPTHPIRLGLALNFSVFYYEILNSPDRACHLAKQVWDASAPEKDVCVCVCMTTMTDMKCSTKSFHPPTFPPSFCILPASSLLSLFIS